MSQATALQVREVTVSLEWPTPDVRDNLCCQLAWIQGDLGNTLGCVSEEGRAAHLLGWSPD